MKNRKKNKVQKNIYFAVGVFLAIALLMLLIVLYVKRIDDKVDELSEKNMLVFVSSDNELRDNGLYTANIKEDLDDFIEGKDADTVKYEIEEANFYLIIDILREDGVFYRLEKIVCDDYDVNARVGVNNIESIEYRTGNPIEATVIKIDCSNNDEYFAMTEETNYMLGKDIESISYMDDHFYYMSYNPKYEILKEQQSCSKEIRNQIDGFNKNHYYYKYGKINFLKDYYQKLSSRTYTVEEKCKEFDREEN